VITQIKNEIEPLIIEANEIAATLGHDILF
jgi:hypothetical protein